MPNLTSQLDAARFDYEYLGKTPEELAEKYKLDLSLLVRLIEEVGWESKAISIYDPEQENSASELATHAEQLQEYVEQRLIILDLANQLERAPLLGTLETAVLEKAIDCAHNIDPEERTAASQLKQLEQVIRSIRQRSPLASMYSNVEDDDSGSKVVVQILNNNGSKTS